MLPKEWRDMTIGKTYDMDHAYNAQCWDYAEYFRQYFSIMVSFYCSLTGYVCDLWRLKDTYGFSAYFDYIYRVEDLRDGDLVIWDRGSSHEYSHIAFYMHDENGNPVELGQNQGYPFVTEKQTTWDMLGALRWKGWGDVPIGHSIMQINGHQYKVYRQNPETEEPIVISAGLNKLASIHELDIEDRYIMAKIAGASYFQMREGQADPYGTTYGDLSSPLCDVWTEVPNQDTTLYYDIEDGVYGDCTGIHIDPTHNVFSPAVVYPKTGNYQYARMVGIDHVNTVSRYTCAIRFADGTYATVLALQDSTPKTIAADFRNYNIHSIAFLDGGGSAQEGSWDGEKFAYGRDTGREIPSAFAIAMKEKIAPPINVEPVIPEPVPEPQEPEQEQPEEPEGGEDMSENNNNTTLEPVEDWKDPEQNNVLVDRIAALLSVKSLITIALTVAFIMLVVQEKELPDQFISIYTMCISFFFGYQFRKQEGGK